MAKNYPEVGDGVFYFPTIDQIAKITDDLVIVNGKIKEPEREIDCNIPVLNQPLAAVIVAVWGIDLVNLKVHLDGNLIDLWITSTSKTTKENKSAGGWLWKYEID